MTKPEIVYLEEPRNIAICAKNKSASPIQPYGVYSNGGIYPRQYIGRGFWTQHMLEQCRNFIHERMVIDYSRAMRFSENATIGHPYNNIV
jgi:hypothetical protein